MQEFLRLARASWLSLSGVVALFLLGGVALAVLLPPVYRSEVVMAPVEDDMSAAADVVNQLGGIAQLAGIALPKESKRAMYVATLKSRVLTEAFIEQNNLLPILFPRKWDGGAKRWKSDDPLKQPAAWDGFRLFDTHIRTIQDDRRTGLVTLTIEWRDPIEAAQWANELVARANSRLRGEAIAESTQTIKYLGEQLDAAPVIEVRQLLFRLVANETKKIAVAKAREEFAFRVIDPAAIARKRSAPNRILIIGLGLVLGMLVVTGILLLRTASPWREREGEASSNPGGAKNLDAA